MKVEFIAIGDEILSGRTQDTNGKWLARFLTSHEIKLNTISVIADSKQAIRDQLQQSWHQSDLVIISGGLGPTKDDITKSSLANFFDKKMGPNEQALKIAKQNYRNFKKEFNPETTCYHIFPQDFLPLANPCGAAPGLLYQENQTLLISAPGVPREFQQMVEHIAWPEVKKRMRWEASTCKQISIRTYGISEEDIFFKLSPTLWEQLGEFGKVSSLPQNFAVDIVVTLNDPKQETQLTEWIQQSPLAPYIWQIGDVPLPQYIIEKATQKGITISLAESCTGGMVSSALTDVPGSSAVFMGSIVSYSNEAKSELIDVPKELLIEHGAVSPQVAKAMAVGARKKLHSDIAISLTGIAGPGGATKQKPVGTMAMGFATNERSESQLHHFFGDRLKLKERFTRAALFKLIELIGL